MGGPPRHRTACRVAQPAKGEITRSARRHPTRLAALALVAALGFMASACTVLSNAHVLEARLDNAGYLNASVNFVSDNAGAPNDIIRITTDVSARISGVANVDREPQNIAKIVWQTFPYSFSGIEISLRQFITTDYTTAQLTSIFGPRPNGLDRQPLNVALIDNAVNVAETALLAALGFVVFLVLVTLLIIKYRRTVKRRRGVEIREALREYSEKEDREANPLLSGGQAARHNQEHLRR